MEGKLGLCLLMNLLYNVYLCFDCSSIWGRKSAFGVGGVFFFGISYIYPHVSGLQDRLDGVKPCMNPFCISQP
jgi:hypothetical protein